MQIKSILFSAVLFLSPVSVFAGSGHDHGHDHGHSHAPITQGEIETVAKSGMLNLVEQKKIDDSWKSVAIEKAIKKEFNGSEEWVISFKNEAISDASKQTIYIFLTLSGEFIAANYTGQ